MGKPDAIRNRTAAWLGCVLACLSLAGCVPPLPDEGENQVELSIAGGTLSVAVGESVTVEAAPSDSSGAPISGLYTMSWVSANPQVATITASGVLTGVANGATTITATAKIVKTGATLTASAPVTVGSGAPAPTPAPAPAPAPTATVSVFPSSAAPTSPNGNDGTAIEVGMKFRVTQTGSVVALRYYKGAGSTGTRTGYLLSSTGTQLATATFTSETASGWQQVQLASPVLLSTGVTYVVAVLSPTGAYVSSPGFFTAAVVNGPLRALADGEDGPNGLYLYTATPALPTQTFQSNNYYVDVAFTPSTASTSPAPAPATGARSTLSFSVLPFSGADLVAPGRGVEQWHDQNLVDVPVEGVHTTRPDKYYRFLWRDLESAKGSYTFSAFDAQINDAIDHRQKFGFGVMPLNPSANTQVGGANLSYPNDLHAAMQAEAVRDYALGGSWIPNWNSNNYLSRLEAFYVALNAHIQAGSYKGVAYKDVINYVDVRGYGYYGEWWLEAASAVPAGTIPTVTTFNRIIDAHVNGFPDFPLVVMIAAFDGNNLNNTMVPPAVGYHALTAKNNFGPLGWRRDNWGALDGYLRMWTDQSTVVFNGLSFQTAIMSRWMTSPIVGEPMNGGTDSGGTCAYYDLENQVRRYHGTSFGNGNYAGTDGITCMRNNIRAASKAAGYRIEIDSGTYVAALGSDRGLGIALDWKNSGISPTYENWNVVYELRNASGASVWSATSSFKPKLFLPSTSTTHSDETFTVPTSVASGSYSLHLAVRDPSGYRSPLPLAISGAGADGSYTLGNVAVP